MLALFSEHIRPPLRTPLEAEREAQVARRRQLVKLVGLMPLNRDRGCEAFRRGVWAAREARAVQ